MVCHSAPIKTLFSKILYNCLCIFREAIILTLDHVLKLSVTLYMFVILKHGKYPTLTLSLSLSYPSLS